MVLKHAHGFCIPFLDSWDSTPGSSGSTYIQVEFSVFSWGVPRIFNTQNNKIMSTFLILVGACHDLLEQAQQGVLSDTWLGTLALTTVVNGSVNLPTRHWFLAAHSMTEAILCYLDVSWTSNRHTQSCSAMWYGRGMDMDELAEDQKQNNHLQLRCQGVSSLWPLWDMETRHGSRGPHGDEPHTRRSNKMRAHSYGRKYQLWV
jgi:hypothetical protein